MQLTEEQILALAPDDASRKAGRELSNPGKWVSRGCDEAALWGECKGSGSKPYQTQIDLSQIAFKCSCPSRKFPCKHGLGLLLYRSKNPADFTETNQPAWVAEWLGKRSEKEEKKAEKIEKPVDEAAKAKRQQARFEKVNDGIEELLLWIKDIIRNGIIGVPEKGNAYWLNMGKRLVDAQAGALAGMVNDLSTINYYNEGWQTIFLDQLLNIYMVAEGYRNIETLPPTLQQDVRSLVGFNQNQEEVKAAGTLRDDWFILGRQTEDEAQLTIERNWLFGMHSGRYALVLNFFVKSQPKDNPLMPGTTIDAELAFYPSATPLRALIAAQHGIKKNVMPTGVSGWQQVVTTQAANLYVAPFAMTLPFIVQELRPVNYNKKWWLQDSENKMMEMTLPESKLWKLVAISGGNFLPTAIVGAGTIFTPIGVWYNNEYKLI